MKHLNTFLIAFSVPFALIKKGKLAKILFHISSEISSDDFVFFVVPSAFLPSKNSGKSSKSFTKYNSNPRAFANYNVTSFEIPSDTFSTFLLTSVNDFT